MNVAALRLALLRRLRVTQFTLAPGRYRVYDEERRAVLIDSIRVALGKSVTVRLRP